MGHGVSSTLLSLFLSLSFRVDIRWELWEYEHYAFCIFHVAPGFFSSASVTRSIVIYYSDLLLFYRFASGDTNFPFFWFKAPIVCSVRCARVSAVRSAVEALSAAIGLITAQAASRSELNTSFCALREEI